MTLNPWLNLGSFFSEASGWVTACYKWRIS